MEDNNKKPKSVNPQEIKNRRKEVSEKGLNGSEDRFKLLFEERIGVKSLLLTK